MAVLREAIGFQLLADGRSDFAPVYLLSHFKKLTVNS